MKSSAALQRKQQRLKLIVIPVLVTILAAVLCWPASEDAAPPMAAVRQPAAAITTVAAAPAVLSTPKPPPAAPRWPEVRLHEITAVNPFAKPAEEVEVSAQPDADPAPPPSVGPWLQLATELAALAQRQPGQPAASGPATATAATDRGDAESLVTALDYATVGRLNAIMHSGRGRFALLNGNQVVQEGDKVPGGFRVVQITDDQIWVQPVGE